MLRYTMRYQKQLATFTLFPRSLPFTAINVHCRIVRGARGWGGAAHHPDRGAAVPRARRRGGCVGVQGGQAGGQRPALEEWNSGHFSRYSKGKPPTLANILPVLLKSREQTGSDWQHRHK